jgi:nitric oxide reductase
VVTLLEHPDQLKDLKADPSLAKLFVEELCRFHTTSSFATRRVAKVDIMVRDKVRIVPIDCLSLVSH